MMMQCPFCLEDNKCAANGAGTCWCFSACVPNGLLALVPQSCQSTQCICQKCVELYLTDKVAFIKRFHFD